MDNNLKEIHTKWKKKEKYTFEITIKCKFYIPNTTGLNKEHGKIWFIILQLLPISIIALKLIPLNILG